jgi:hypothetical protein
MIKETFPTMLYASALAAQEHKFLLDVFMGIISFAHNAASVEMSLSEVDCAINLYPVHAGLGLKHKSRRFFFIKK